MIQQKKWQQLRNKMKLLNISEDDCIEKFIVGFGRGGQKLQKTSSCVCLKHNPTGIVIKCQQSRFRESNRYYARQRLCERVEDILFQEKSERQREIEKIRKQKKRRSRRVKEKILADKHHRALTKEGRKKPDSND